MTNVELLREPEELYPNEHEPPADQTVLEDSDLLDKLADLLLCQGVSVLPHRLALRQALARLL
jgi:hypothetical protein